MKVLSILKNKNTIALALSLLIIAGTYAVITNFSPFYTERAIGATGGPGGGPSGGGPSSGGGGVIDENNNGNGGGAGVGDLCGWAWGATTETPSPKMGVGWISVNSTDCDTDGNGVMSSAEATANPSCPAAGASVPAYKLTVDSNRYITGYAWSSNLGWLKFGSLSGAPGSGGDARVSNNSGNSPVTGWARFCAGSAAGDCSSTSRDDGWDGWLKLSDSWSNGMSYEEDSNGKRLFKGYSWGGPVVGWIKWDQASGQGVRYCSDPILSGSLGASPSSGMAPMNTTLTASYQLSGSNQTPSYRFRCDTTDSWSSSRSGSNAHIYPRPGTGESGCSYDTGGRYYHPEVEITVGSQVVTPSSEVHVTNNNTGPNELGAVCDVTPERVFLNNSATWTVELTQAGIPPYTYTFSFDDGKPNPAPIVTDEAEVQISRLQNTLGKKTLNVTVQDSTSPSPSHGQCTTNVQVIVNPTIIEI